MAEQIVIATGVMGFVLVVSAVVAAVVVGRSARRRYDAVRSRVLRYHQPQRRRQLQGRTRAPASVASVAAASLGSPGWWRAQNHRHRMWKAVTSAEHAVGVAEQAKVAMGDLARLARDLHAAATALDAVLRASGRQGALGQEDRADCDRIVVAATELRDAALSSLRAGSHADTDVVVSAVRIEVAALAAGLRAAHR